jgi:hypothetical protein
MARTALAEALLGQGKYSEAASAAEEAVKTSNISPADVARAKNIRAIILGNQGERQAAEQMLLESCKDLDMHFNSLSLSAKWQIPRACRRMVHFYNDWHKPDETRKWQNEQDRWEAEIKRIQSVD